jgi:hypothetical protein
MATTHAPLRGAATRSARSLEGACLLVLPAAREEIARLDARLGAVVDGYLRRLARDPARGRLERRGRFRRIYVDRDDEPARLWPPLPHARDQDGLGPRWRICYRLEHTRSAGAVIVVLAVGLGHAGTAARDAYALAEERVEAMLARRAGAARA